MSGMKKISAPQELVQELQGLIRKTSEGNPSREVLSSELRKLADRVAKTFPERELSRLEEQVYVRIRTAWTKMTNFPDIFKILHSLRDKGLIEYKIQEKEENSVILARRLKS